MTWIYWFAYADLIDSSVLMLSVPSLGANTLRCCFSLFIADAMATLD